jgi:large subunit ribosomal protein L24
VAHRLKIRKGDTVKVITGKDKGKTGTVKAVEPKKQRVFVEGLNMTTRHQRPRTIRDAQRAGEVGGVTHQEGPIHISNVMLLDPKSNDTTRVGIKREDGQRKRIAKKSGEEID